MRYGTRTARMHEYEHDIEREEVPVVTLLIPFLARQQGISGDQAHIGSSAAFSILSYIFLYIPMAFPSPDGGIFLSFRPMILADLRRWMGASVLGHSSS